MTNAPFEELAQLIRLRRYRESVYAMIGAYLDESFDMKKSGIFAVGGIMARGVPIFELDRRWHKLLRRPDIDVEYFKASQCAAGAKQFAKFVADPKSITTAERDRLDSIHMEFLQAITLMPFHKSSYIVAAGVGVVQDDFYDIIKDDYAKQILGNSPFFLAYHLCMIQCAWTMKEAHEGAKHIHNSVAFICDECEEHEEEAHEAYRQLKATNPKAAEYLGSYSTLDEKECNPLQAADAVIYEIRKALHLALKQREGTLRDHFRIMSDTHMMFSIQHANRKNLEHIVATHRPGEPFNLDAIMDDHYNENIKF